MYKYCKLNAYLIVFHKRRLILHLDIEKLSHTHGEIFEAILVFKLKPKQYVPYHVSHRQTTAITHTPL